MTRHLTLPFIVHRHVNYTRNLVASSSPSQFEKRTLFRPRFPQFIAPKMVQLLQYLPFSRSATLLQALTYLLGISLFSISFLVFLNSSVSFVITDLIGRKDGVGDIVGTLGFVDELVALVACPIWGLVSDRLGVRMVAVVGYLVIGLALFLFVQARNVYPQLLLARIFFAIGATAA